jgi:dTDP-4-amino-4,6-dideoxygalactose transaminase
VFADIDPITLGVSIAEVESCLTPRTRAIVPVHYGIAACPMDELTDLADRSGLRVVEDAALALGGRHAGRALGSFGAMSTLSFHDTKSIQCGEGGALVLNEPGLVARAEILREKGTDRRAFTRGQVERYSWLDVGSSYLLAEPLAAMLVAQLDAFDHIQRRRREIFDRYTEQLSPWAADAGVTLPATATSGSIPSALIFHLLLPDAMLRTRWIEHLASHEVESTFHYVPLHSSPAGRRYGRARELPVTDSVAARLVRLPLYPDLGDGEIDRVVEAVTSFAP